MTAQEINQLIKDTGVDTNLISDGYHTFGELYEHRIRLFITLCHLQKEHAWKSRCHDDGVEWPGWIILGLFTEKGRQITYHLAASYWEELAEITTLEKAPDYDGHSSADVLNRLQGLHLAPF